MAKAKQTTKKAVTKNTSTPTKAVAKKAVATPSAKKTATKSSSVKKAEVEKEKTLSTPSKSKTEAKKTATKAKVVATKSTKTNTEKKTTVIVKKTNTTEPKTIKKEIKPIKEVKESKTAVLKKEEKSTKAINKKVETTKNNNATATKAAAKAKIKAKVAKSVTKEVEIVDAIAKKSDLKKAKPGTIALRDLDRKGTKKKVAEEETAESFNPTRSSLLNETETFGPVFRYSDEDLNEFKELILKRLDVARENLNYYQALMARKDESGTEDTDNRFNAMEDGGGAMEREQLSQFAARQMLFIDHLEKALVRIENKTYGICRVTGKLIEKARLKAVPHATLSMEAKTNRR